MMILQRGRETVRECPSSLISGFALVLVMVLWENMDRKVCAGERERGRRHGCAYTRLWVIIWNGIS